MSASDTSARNETAGPAVRRQYRILGLTLDTNATFQTQLLPGTADADLTFELRQGERLPDWPVPSSGDFESAVRLDGDQPLFSLHRGPQGDLFRFSQVADYFLTGTAIEGHLLNPDHDFMVETHFLGMVLSYWLERQGLPVLHASSVSVDDQAVAFLGTNKAGKSSLAVALMQKGYPLLSDDLVGLQPSESGIDARPGFPSMRMWPDLAEFVMGPSWEQLPLAHPRFVKRRLNVGPGGFANFLDRTQPLVCLYVPERRDDDAGPGKIQIEPVPPGQALFELLRGSFLPWLSQVRGFSAGRLQVLNTLAARVPVRRLVYPGGFENLPAVSDRILEDVAQLGKSGATGPS